MGTVRAELAFPLENRGSAPAAVARGVEEAALALGIAGLLDRSTHELSGGELQRVALAAALAGRPRLLLLDEPTSQLDPVAGDELLGVLRRVNEEWGTAVLLAEHRLERCLPAADRVLALEDGRLAFDGTPEASCAAAPETPVARLFALAGRPERPVTVKAARARARRRRRAAVAAPTGARPRAPRRRAARAPRRAGARARLARARRDDPARRRPARSSAGDAVALMGRNGAGKSTLLQVAAGLWKPDARQGAPRPGASRCCCSTPATTCCTSASTASCRRPSWRRPASATSPRATRATSPAASASGSRWRSCCAPRGAPAAVCLDEPTRGMDRGHKERLARRLRELAAGGTAVVVATHDAEFAAAFAARTVLLGDGRPVADAPTAEVLGGGWYFATQTARVLGQGALTPEQGAALLADRAAGGAPHDLDRWPRRCSSAPCSSRASPGTSARTRPRACSRSWRRSPRWPRSAASPSRRCRTSSRRPTSS